MRAERQKRSAQNTFRSGVPKGGDHRNDVAHATTLRHTFASRLVSRGVDIVTVQQLLGHSDVTVTMRYTHANLDSKHAAAATLEAFPDNLVTVCTKMQQ